MNRLDGHPTPEEIARMVADDVVEHAELLTDEKLAEVYLALEGEAYDRKLTTEDIRELAGD